MMARLLSLTTSRLFSDDLTQMACISRSNLSELLPRTKLTLSSLLNPPVASLTTSDLALSLSQSHTTARIIRAQSPKPSLSLAASRVRITHNNSIHSSICRNNSTRSSSLSTLMREIMFMLCLPSTVPSNASRLRASTRFHPKALLKGLNNSTRIMSPHVALRMLNFLPTTTLILRP